MPCLDRLLIFLCRYHLDLAKTSPHVLYPERFALHLGTYLVSKYAHIHKAFITIEQLRWKRIDVNGQEHSHAFWRDGEEKRTAEVVVSAPFLTQRSGVSNLSTDPLGLSIQIDATQGTDKIVANVKAGIKDLLGELSSPSSDQVTIAYNILNSRLAVLKSTGSAFEGFVRDEHTTLVEVDDRIFSTAVDLSYTYAPFPVTKSTSLDAPELVAPADSGAGSAWDGEAVATRARAATLEIFAVDESASVQVRRTRCDHAAGVH